MTVILENVPALESDESLKVTPVTYEVTRSARRRRVVPALAACLFSVLAAVLAGQGLQANPLHLGWLSDTLLSILGAIICGAFIVSSAD